MKKLKFFLGNAAAIVACLALSAAFAGCNGINGDGPEEPETPEPGGTPPWSGPISAFGDVGPRANDADDPEDGIYVSPDGNNATADGSIDAPYKSINAALAAASPGGTVILRGGTYREGAATEVRIRQPNITIKSKKGEWAHIDLPFPANIKDQNDGNSAVHFDPDASGCKLQGIEVTGGYYAVVVETTWDWGIKYYPTRYGASNITIEDCVLHDSRYDVVKVKPNCNNITIRFNEIYNSGRAFTGSPLNGEDNAEGIDNVNGDGMAVQNNYIHDICSTGVYAKGGATGVLIENNRIERAHAGGIMAGFDTSPEFFDVAANPRYYENIQGVVRNNLIIDAGWEGIGLYASKDAQVYNNTVVNAVSGALKYHSPVYFGAATQDWGNPAGCPPNVNPSVHHNIVSQPSSYTGRMIEIRYIKEGDVYPSRDIPSLEGNPAMHDNCYYVAGKSATFTDNRPPAVTNMGVAAWQAHTGGESGSLEADPALDADYLPANAQCAAMGIQWVVN